MYLDLQFFNLWGGFKYSLNHKIRINLTVYYHRLTIFPKYLCINFSCELLYTKKNMFSKRIVFLGCPPFIAEKNEQIHHLLFLIKYAKK